jgi:hypothetical protein
MRDRRTLIEAADANERGGKFNRAKKLGAKKWERHSSANFAALDHFPVLNLPVESQQTDDATPSERRSSIDIRNVAKHRGFACVFDERLRSPGPRR